MSKTVAFTGKRPQNLPWRFNEQDERCLRLKEKMRAEIKNRIEEDYTKFIVGMALGVDTYAAEAVLELKNSYPSITIEAAIPCDSQNVKWCAADKQRYNEILGKCDKITYVGRKYTADCMMKRNYYMVDNANLLIAVCNELSGGTGATIRYAREKDIEVVLIQP